MIAMGGGSVEVRVAIETSVDVGDGLVAGRTEVVAAGTFVAVTVGSERVGDGMGSKVGVAIAEHATSEQITNKKVA